MTATPGPASPIELRRDGNVFVLHMRAGENRLGRGLLDAFQQALDEVEASRGDVALVSTGEGRFYSTGLDLEALARGDEDPRALLAELHRLFARLLAFPVATVAALNGHAFAAGGMLALAHDFRVMRADRGWFCLPEVDLATGRALTKGMYALLGARLPRPTLHEALVTGRRYGGSEAVERRITQEALPEAEVLPRALEIARSLAPKHRETLAALKRGLFAATLETLSRESEAD